MNASLHWRPESNDASIPKLHEPVDALHQAVYDAWSGQSARPGSPIHKAEFSDEEMTRAWWKTFRQEERFDALSPADKLEAIQNYLERMKNRE